MKLGIKKKSLFKMLGILVVIIMIFPILFEAKASEEVIIVNDFSVGNEVNEFKFNGNWVGTTPSSGQYNNDEHWINISKGASNVNDIYYTVKFEGEKIELYGNKAPSLGKCAISIDGGEEVIVNAYSANKAMQQKIYESPTLEKGIHIIKVRATGQGDGATANMQIDFAKVYSSKYLETGIEITPEEINIKVDDSEKINVKVLSQGEGKKDILWESDNPSVATIKNGKATGISQGTANIIVTLEEGNFTKVCKVKVDAKN